MLLASKAPGSSLKRQLRWTAKHLARLTPQPKLIAAKEHKERKDGTLSLCVLCVLSRQKFAQKNNTFQDSSANHAKTRSLKRMEGLLHPPSEESKALLRSRI